MCICMRVVCVCVFVCEREIVCVCVCVRVRVRATLSVLKIFSKDSSCPATLRRLGSVARGVGASGTASSLHKLSDAQVFEGSHHI